MASGSSSDIPIKPKRPKRKIKPHTKSGYIYSSGSDLYASDDEEGDKSYKSISKKQSTMVSNWTEQYLTEIGISYEGEAYMDTHKLLDCVPTITKLNKLSEQTMATMDCLDKILDFNLGIDTQGQIGSPVNDNIKYLNEKIKEIESCRYVWIYGHTKISLTKSHACPFGQ